MENVEILGGEQFFEHVLVLFEDVLHQHVGFAHGATGYGNVVTAEALVILEEGQRPRVAEELTEETQLADRDVGEAVGAEQFHRLVDDVMLAAVLQHALDLAAVILPGVQFALGRRFDEFLVGAAVGERVGERVTGIAWGEQLAAMLVRLPFPELVAIDEIGAEKERLDELFNGSSVTTLFDIRFHQRGVFGELLRIGGALDDLFEKLIHELGDLLTGDARFLTLALESIAPVAHTLGDDGAVVVTGLAVFQEGGAHDGKLRFGGRLGRGGDGLRHALEKLIHVDAHVVHAHHDLPLAEAGVDPIPFGSNDHGLVHFPVLRIPQDGRPDFRAILDRHPRVVEAGKVHRLAIRSDRHGRRGLGGGEFRQQRIVLFLEDFDQQRLDVRVEIRGAIRENFLMLPFRSHDRVNRGNVGSAFRTRHHVGRELLSVREHGQQMASIQGGRVVVADAALRGQQEGVGYIDLCAVAVVVADDGVTLAVDVALGREFQQLVHFRVEDEFADKPTAVGREAGEILVFSGKQFPVIDLVAEVRPAELVRKFRRVVRFQHARQPILQLLPLFRGGLVFFLRRHFLKVHLLVHPVHHIKPGVQRQLLHVIEAKLSFFRALLVAVDAVIFHNRLCRGIDFKHRRFSGCGERRKNDQGDNMLRYGHLLECGA